MDLWLPEDFEHPGLVSVPPDHHLRPIRASDVDIDYPAVMSSRERLWSCLESRTVGHPSHSPTRKILPTSPGMRSRCLIICRSTTRCSTMMRATLRVASTSILQSEQERMLISAIGWSTRSSGPRSQHRSKTWFRSGSEVRGRLPTRESSVLISRGRSGYVYPPCERRSLQILDLCRCRTVFGAPRCRPLGPTGCTGFGWPGQGATRSGSRPRKVQIPDRTPVSTSFWRNGLETSFRTLRGHRGLVTRSLHFRQPGLYLPFQYLDGTTLTVSTTL